MSSAPTKDSRTLRSVAGTSDRLLPGQRSGGASRPSVRSQAFTINGRFAAQPVTGVQRYGREITRSLDELLDAGGLGGTLAMPAGDAVPPVLRAVEIVRRGPLHGHAWEQVTLPSRYHGPLLNLCNTAPAILREQVVCMHDANVYSWPESYGRGFRLAYKTLQPLLARRAMRITTVSKAAALQLARYLPLGADRIEVLPNGHEHVLRWNASASHLLGDGPARRPFVLLLGSRARHKNATLVLKLADALDALGLDLYVAGGSAAIFAAAPGSSAANVRWLGVVSDDDLALLFSRALCLAFPSFTEGFGLPILEAMALGCPVISSDRASMPEICGDAALLAAPDDPALWLSHIKALARSPALGEELRGRGRGQAAGFSWAASARGYMALLGL